MTPAPAVTSKDRRPACDWYLVGSLLLGPWYAALHVAGQTGEALVWQLLAAWGVLVVCNLKRVQDLLLRRFGRPGAILHGGGAAFSLAALMFQSGWGSVFTFSLIAMITIQIDREGGWVWRWSLACTATAASVGHLLVVLGVWPANVPSAVANFSFAAGLAALAAIGKAYGTSREDVEAEILARRMSEARFRSLVENAHEGVLLLSGDGAVTWASPAMERLVGVTTASLLAEGWLTLIHPGDVDRASETFQLVLAPQGRVVAVVRGLHGDGTWHWLECTATNRLDDPAVEAVVVNIKDVTESHAYQDRLTYAATRDSLTGLLNRPAFLERLDSALSRARRKADPAAVLFLDLDDFKSVNDRWGHQAGDVLLQAVATRLLGAVRPGDTVGRLGGDEFVVLLEDLSSAGDAEIVADRIRQALSSPLMIGEHPIVPMASVGIAATTARGESADELMHVADLRMYLAKQRALRGGPRSSSEPSGTSETDIDAAAVERALAAGEFFLEYQPVVDLGTGRASWVEALVRWNHPERGRLAPDAFLPQVEALGLMPALGRRVLEDGCRTVSRWSEDVDLSAVTLAVNASVSQLRDPAFPEMVREVLAGTRLPAAQLVIEVTESLPVTPEDQALSTVTALGRLGVRVALDDFGAGYASLAQLDLVHAHIVKLDRQLIARIETASDGFMQGLIDLLHSLGVVLIAEGIETEPQQRAVAATGIRYAQGYHLGRPSSAERVLPLLENRAASSQPA